MEAYQQLFITIGMGASLLFTVGLLVIVTMFISSRYEIRKHIDEQINKIKAKFEKPIREKFEREEAERKELEAIEKLRGGQEKIREAEAAREAEIIRKKNRNLPEIILEYIPPMGDGLMAFVVKTENSIGR